MQNEIEFLSFVPLLGREVTDQALLDFLVSMGVPAPVETEEILENHYLELHELGLLLVFEKEGDVRNKLPYPVKNGAQVLVSVSAYGGSEEGYARFDGILPDGITFDLSREAVATLLGPPDWSSPAVEIDRWHKPDHRMIFDFQEEKSAISLELP